MEEIRTEIENKKLVIFKSGKISAPAVYVNMYEDSASELLSECEKLSGRAFHLICVSGLDWNGDLSPWKHDAVMPNDDAFSGNADGYMRFLTDQLIPFAEENIKPEFRIIAGYSLGGLFALYAPHITDVFSRAVSASGSTWFTGFVPYVCGHEFLRRPDAVYLSLGDKESHARNQYLSTVQDRTEELFSFYKSRSVETVFELNPGNHFNEPNRRLAKGIIWALDVL